MAEMPQLPDLQAVAEWLVDFARHHHTRVVQVACRDRATARIWQAVLQETRVPFPITVRLWMPRHERMDSLQDYLVLSPEDRAYEAIVVEVQRG